MVNRSNTAVDANEETHAHTHTYTHTNTHTSAQHTHREGTDVRVSRQAQAVVVPADRGRLGEEVHPDRLRALGVQAVAVGQPYPLQPAAAAAAASSDERRRQEGPT